MLPPKLDSGTRKFLNRLIVIGFMVLVGYCLAKSVESRSIVGFILALTSLGSGVYFLYLLVKAGAEPAQEENS